MTLGFIRDSIKIEKSGFGILENCVNRLRTTNDQLTIYLRNFRQEDVELLESRMTWLKDYFTQSGIDESRLTFSTEFKWKQEPLEVLYEDNIFIFGLVKLEFHE